MDGYCWVGGGGKGANLLTEDVSLAFEAGGGADERKGRVRFRFSGIDCRTVKQGTVSSGLWPLGWKGKEKGFGELGDGKGNY